MKIITISNGRFIESDFKVDYIIAHKNKTKTKGNSKYNDTYFITGTNGDVYQYTWTNHKKDLE